MAALSGAMASFVLVFATLFPVVDPPGAAPFFYALTTGASRDLRRRLAWRVALNGLVLQVAVLLIGAWVLDFFGISIPAVKVAGGLLIASTAWGMLGSGESERQSQPTAQGDDWLLGQAFFPLTMPLTIGPGAIAITLTLGVFLPQESWVEIAGRVAGALVAIAAIALCIYLCFRYADLLAQMLGEMGTKVMLRLTAFILLCIGVQIAASGTMELAADLLAHSGLALHHAA